ncbi:MAG: hypothetical protein ABEJ08_05030 [Halobacteriaceae archaeon]
MTVRRTRRAVLAAGATLSAGPLAGCSGSSDGPAPRDAAAAFNQAVSAHERALDHWERAVSLRADGALREASRTFLRAKNDYVVAEEAYREAATVADDAGCRPLAERSRPRVRHCSARAKAASAFGKVTLLRHRNQSDQSELHLRRARDFAADARAAATASPPAEVSLEDPPCG